MCTDSFGLWRGRWDIWDFDGCPLATVLVPSCWKVKHHLATCSPSQAVQELNDNLYVDDLLMGADSTGEACSIIHDASSVMKQAHMPLAKWVSNSAEVADVLQREFQVFAGCIHQGTGNQVVGSIWCLLFQCCFSTWRCVTKRIVLSFFSRLFDPFGFTAPFAMLAKCLFQDLWFTVPCSTVGWRAARVVQDPVLALGRWS